MEWTTCQRAIFLLDYDHINGTTECCWIDGIPCLRDGAADAPNILHFVAMKIQRIRCFKERYIADYASRMLC